MPCHSQRQSRRRLWRRSTGLAKGLAPHLGGLQELIAQLINLTDSSHYSSAIDQGTCCCPTLTAYVQANTCARTQAKWQHRQPPERCIPVLPLSKARVHVEHAATCVPPRRASSPLAAKQTQPVKCSLRSAHRRARPTSRTQPLQTSLIGRVHLEYRFQSCVPLHLVGCVDLQRQLLLAWMTSCCLSPEQRRSHCLPSSAAHALNLSLRSTGTRAPGASSSHSRRFSCIAV